MTGSTVRGIFLPVLCCAFFIGTCCAQTREYSWNKPGNECYLRFICYAQNNEYSSLKRPLIFILGPPEEPAIVTYQNDSLKNIKQFYNYEFIYISNPGGRAAIKLNCLAGFAEYFTGHYSFGKSNLFLVIRDPVITQEDIDASGIIISFKSVQLFRPKSETDIINVRNTIISETSEIISNQENVSGEDADNKEDIYGTYYIEPDAEKSEDASTVTVTSHKTYFGSPSSFNFNLSGIVHDESNREALPFATVMVRGTSIGTTTNADGFFTLIKIPNDTSVIIVQYVGYDRTEIYLDPHTPKKNLNIELRKAAYNLKAVTIAGHRSDEVVLANKGDISIVKMTPRKIESLPNIGEKDIMRSFQLMPGISAANESSSGLYVRGGTPDQNLILYDGFTVYYVDHLYGFYSAFNSNALKDVQIYKGGFESKFGGRLSSVTEITGKDGNQKKWNIGGDLSLLSLNAYVEVPIGKKFSSIIAYRRSYKGPIYNLIFKKFNNSSRSSGVTRSGGAGGMPTQETKITSYFYDLNGKFTYRPHDNDIISLSIFNGTDKLDNSSSMDASGFGASNSEFSMSTTDLTKYGNVGGSLKWSRKWNQKIYGNTILSYSNYYSKRDRSQERTMTNSSGEATTFSSGIFENNDLKDYSLKTDYQYDLFNFCQLQYGAFGTWYDIKYTYAESDTATILERKNQALLAGTYLQSKLKFLKDKLQLLPGIRASYFQTTNKFYFEPRASLSYSITKRLALKTAFGLYYQFTNRVTREDIMSGSKDFWLLSDGDKVPVSSSLHYIAGLSYETDNLLFSAEAYYKKTNDLTEYSLRFKPSPMGVSYDENFFHGNSFARGIEFLVQKKSGNINGWISYTLAEAKNHFSIYSDSYYPANQDVTHEFKIVGLYKLKRWDFSATWIYATGRPYTAPSGAYNITLLDGTSQQFYTVTSKNGLRLPDYHRCDISISYKLLVGSKGDKKRREIGYIAASAFNLYDRRNVWYKQYTIQDGEIISTNVNYLGITPNLTLSLKLR
jgi:ferric enterobactin receptor